MCICQISLKLTEGPYTYLNYLRTENVGASWKKVFLELVRLEERRDTLFINVLILLFLKHSIFLSKQENKETYTSVESE